MSRKRDRSEPREQRHPMATVANVSDDFIAQLNLPTLPDSIPARLSEAVRNRIDALFFRLKEARTEKYVKALEVRLVREAYQAVLVGYELGIPDAAVLYASFRRLVRDLGYVAVDVGFVREQDDGFDPQQILR